MVAKKDGIPAKVPGLILKSKNDLRRFLRSVERKKNQQERKSQFTDTEFDINEHLDELNSSNIQLEL